MQKDIDIWNRINEKYA